MTNREFLDLRSHTWHFPRWSQQARSELLAKLSEEDQIWLNNNCPCHEIVPVERAQSILKAVVELRNQRTPRCNLRSTRPLIQGILPLT